MRTKFLSVALATVAVTVALAVAGCSQASAPNNTAGGTSSTSPTTAAAAGAGSGSAADSGAATAEQVAKELRGNVSCPAGAPPPRPAGSPVDDVVGVRPGMSWDDATRRVLCEHPLMVVTENTYRGYDIKTYGQHVRQGFDAAFAVPRVVRTSREIMRDLAEDAARRGNNSRVERLKPGQSRFYVSTMGLPGREVVLVVAREEFFEEGKLPTVDSLRQALVANYGEPSEVNEVAAIVQIWWAHDPSGKTLGPQACRISVSPDAPTSLSPDCGVTVGATIQRSASNPGLAHSLAVTAQDGAAGYAVLQRTEEALTAAEAARQGQEIDKAGKTAVKPRL